MVHPRKIMIRLDGNRITYRVEIANRRALIAMG
jgi:hypothetical protein